LAVENLDDLQATNLHLFRFDHEAFT